MVGQKVEANDGEEKCRWAHGEAFTQVERKLMMIPDESIAGCDSFTWTVNVAPEGERPQTLCVRIYGKPLMRVWNMWISQGPERISALCLWEGRFYSGETLPGNRCRLDSDIGSFETITEDDQHTLVLTAFK